MKYNKQILLRIDQKTKDKLQKKAEKYGLTLTAYLRSWLIEIAKSSNIYKTKWK